MTGSLRADFYVLVPLPSQKGSQSGSFRERLYLLGLSGSAHFCAHFSIGLSDMVDVAQI